MGWGTHKLYRGVDVCCSPSNMGSCCVVALTLGTEGLNKRRVDSDDGKTNLEGEGKMRQFFASSWPFLGLKTNLFWTEGQTRSKSKYLARSRCVGRAREVRQCMRHRGQKRLGPRGSSRLQGSLANDSFT